jgi:hypothetical protein
MVTSDWGPWEGAEPGNDRWCPQTIHGSKGAGDQSKGAHHLLGLGFYWNLLTLTDILGLCNDALASYERTKQFFGIFIFSVSKCNIHCGITFVLRVGFERLNYPLNNQSLDGTYKLIFASSQTTAEFGRCVKVLQAFFAASLAVTHSAIYIVS